MSIATIIEDGTGTNGSAAVVSKPPYKSGLLSYTIPYQDKVEQVKTFTNPTYGADMNKNHAFSGTPEGVHNGGDSVLWTPTALSGTWDFASTTQAYAGTKSVSAINTVNGSTAQFQDATSISVGSYTAISGAIYITGWSQVGTKDVEIELRNSGTTVGNIVRLSNYIDVNTQNSWQTFIIPLDDITTANVVVDQLLVRTISLGGNQPPDYYLDAIQFEETGGSVYSITPDNNSYYELRSIRVSMADVYDSTLLNSSHQNIAYNKLLGLASLSNGMLFTVTSDNEVVFNITLSDHLDFMSLPEVTTDSGGDGTNTWMTYEIGFNPPLIMDSTTNDKFTVALSDNLTGLLSLRMRARGGKIKKGES